MKIKGIMLYILIIVIIVWNYKPGRALKVTVSTILSDFINRILSPKLEQMWVKIYLKQPKTPKSGFHEIFRGETCTQAICVWATLIQVNQDNSASVWWIAHARNRFETAYAYKLKLLQKLLII
jgi:hypothetical protein